MKLANVLMALTLIMPVGSNVAAQIPVSTTNDGSTEISVSVKTDSMKVGDTITLYITMRNMHKDKYCHQVIGETGKAELNGYKIEVADSLGNILPVLKQQRPRGWSYWGQCLDHGKTTSEEMEVNRLVDMSKPGAYRIRVSHPDKMTNEIIWSNSITVTITQ